MYTLYNQLFKTIIIPEHHNFCDTSFAEAQSIHQQTAPQFSSTSQCEAEYEKGNCEQKDGSSWVAPIAAGFLMGSMANNNLSSSTKAQPLYRHKDDEGYYTATGGYAGSHIGKTEIKHSFASAKPIKAQTKQAKNTATKVTSFKLYNPYPALTVITLLLAVGLLATSP